MPYILQEARPAYDELARQLVETLDRRRWPERLGPIVREIGVRIYGPPEHTRYYKQNELIGVLSCMRLEWQQRLNLPDAAVDETLRFALLPDSAAASCSAAVDAIAGACRRQTDESRAGHLNYCLTATMIEVVDRGWCAFDYVPTYIYSVEQWVYRVTTRPYEDTARAKSGDVYPASWLDRGRSP